MATGIAQSALESGSRAQLTRLVYSALFLIATSVLFYVLALGFLIPDYYRNLTTRRFGLLLTVEAYLPLTQSLYFLIQMLLALILFFRPLKQLFDVRALLPLNRSASRAILFGVFTGLITLLATLPVFVRDRPSESVVFVANHFYSGSGLVLALMLVFLLPVAMEILFHGILLRLLLENISVVAALIVSTLLFSLLVFQRDRRCRSRSGCGHPLLQDAKCAGLCYRERIFHCRCRHLANMATDVISTFRSGRRS
jgi:membrane protease YdiL (CAAX protease family)